MTSKLKCPVCPFCSGKLYRSDNCYSCLNDQCLFGDFHFVAKRWNAIIELKQALIQAKQGLEIARKALKQIACADKDGKPLKGVVSCWLDMDELNKCIEQIEHKE